MTIPLEKTAKATEQKVLAEAVDGAPGLAYTFLAYIDQQWAGWVRVQQETLQTLLSTIAKQGAENERLNKVAQNRERAEERHRAAKVEAEASRDQLAAEVERWRSHSERLEEARDQQADWNEEVATRRVQAESQRDLAEELAISLQSRALSAEAKLSALSKLAMPMVDDRHMQSGNERIHAIQELRSALSEQAAAQEGETGERKLPPPDGGGPEPQCGYCARRFWTTGELAEHVYQSHSGPKPPKHTMTLSLTDEEMAALEKLAVEQDLRAPIIFRQALRVYQLYCLPEGHPERIVRPADYGADRLSAPAQQEPRPVEGDRQAVRERIARIITAHVDNGDGFNIDAISRDILLDLEGGK